MYGHTYFATLSRSHAKTHTLRSWCENVRLSNLSFVDSTVSLLFYASFARYLYLTQNAVNGRDKVIGLKGFETATVEQKVQLLLDSSGAKIKPLKGRPVESTTESARGIWSGMHVEQSFRI